MPSVTAINVQLMNLSLVFPTKPVQTRLSLSCISDPQHETSFLKTCKKQPSYSVRVILLKMIGLAGNAASMENEYTAVIEKSQGKATW